MLQFIEVKFKQFFSYLISINQKLDAYARQMKNACFYRDSITKLMQNPFFTIKYQPIQSAFKDIPIDSKQRRNGMTLCFGFS